MSVTDTSALTAKAIAESETATIPQQVSCALTDSEQTLAQIADAVTAEEGENPDIREELEDWDVRPYQMGKTTGV